MFLRLFPRYTPIKHINKIVLIRSFGKAANSPGEMPLCCGTGCKNCVLIDYYASIGVQDQFQKTELRVQSRKKYNAKKRKEEAEAKKLKSQ